jgi:hypothetical protein
MLLTEETFAKNILNFYNFVNGFEKIIKLCTTCSNICC